MGSGTVEQICDGLLFDALDATFSWWMVKAVRYRDARKRYEVWVNVGPGCGGNTGRYAYVSRMTVNEAIRDALNLYGHISDGAEGS